MSPLADAWRWYESTKLNSTFAERLAKRHWISMPASVREDERFKFLAETDIIQRAETTLTWLDDLAILVLFSVFEDAVRSRVRTDMRMEMEVIKHPLLAQAAEEADDDVDNGSFFHFLQAFKSMNVGLIEEVNQVRDYRNWVAHGRRGEPRNRVAPKQARERLERFLVALEVT